MQDIHVESLKEHQELLSTIANIYMQEWGWHFSCEWDIVTLEDMIQDIRDNYLDTTYVAFVDKVFVGTVALLDADLKSHMHLKPWVTCLYVRPEFRKRGIGKQLVDLICKDATSCFLWCYEEHEKNTYMNWNFKIVEEFQYNDKPAWIMQR
jgi:GNAT superfamily N-acetyltransferase